MPKLQIVVEPELAEKVQKAAESMGHTVSSWGRFWFQRILEGDRLTVEECRTLVDPGVEYEADNDHLPTL